MISACPFQHQTIEYLLNPSASDVALRAGTLNQANIRIREAVIDAWKKVLGPKVEAATAGDPLLDILFYDLWGDMVVASQLAVLCRKFGVEVAVEELIQRPTIAQHMRILGDRLGEHR
jgi:aryl carrier-like protein